MKVNLELPVSWVHISSEEDIHLHCISHWYCLISATVFKWFLNFIEISDIFAAPPLFTSEQLIVILIRVICVRVIDRKVYKLKVQFFSCLSLVSTVILRININNVECVCFQVVFKEIRYPRFGISKSIWNELLL